MGSRNLDFDTLLSQVFEPSVKVSLSPSYFPFLLLHLPACVSFRFPPPPSLPSFSPGEGCKLSSGAPVVQHLPPTRGRMLICWNPLNYVLMPKRNEFCFCFFFKLFQNHSLRWDKTCIRIGSLKKNQKKVIAIIATPSFFQAKQAILEMDAIRKFCFLHNLKPHCLLVSLEFLQVYGKCQL